MPERSLGSRALEAARLLLAGVLVALFFSPPVTVVLELALFVLMLALPELRRRLWRALRQPLGALALAFWALVAVGLLYSEAPAEEAIDIWVSWRRILLLPMALALFDDVRPKRQLAWTLAMVAAGFALASYAGVLFGFTYYTYELGIVARNHATQGMFFGVAGFAAVLLLLHEKHHAARAMLGLAAVLVLTNAVFITTGRSGHLVVAVLSVALVWAWPARAPAKRLAWSIGAAILALALLGASPVVRQRLAQGIDEALSYRQSTEWTSAGLRVAFFFNTVELIAERPLVGYGTGAFEAAYTRLVQGRPGMEGMPTHDPHNQFLKITAEHGLLGLILFLALLGSALRQHGVPAPYRLMGLAALLAWCATSLFNSHFSTFAEGRFIWLWLGACLAARQSEA